MFEPKAPPLEKRWAALNELRSANIPVGMCVTPTLPIEDVESFARRVAKFKPDVLVCQDFHDSNGGFGADTGEEARQLLEEIRWGPDDYHQFVARLRQDQHVFEGVDGFFPPPRKEAPDRYTLFPVVEN
jgi:DNA repair photolyase